MLGLLYFEDFSVDKKIETSFVAPALQLSELASVLSLVAYSKKKSLEVATL